ncbi:MAG: leucine-rich repeat domain-containing protein [Clostridia bacterium]|nr:leucine-rich repeat domain-containing protein [Clostridia bacterium]
MERNGLIFEIRDGGYALTATTRRHMRDIVIPSEIDGIPIVGIEKDAFDPDMFRGKFSVRSLHIPKTLRYIQNGAFVHTPRKRASVKDLSAWYGVDYENWMNSPFSSRFAYIYSVRCLPKIEISDAVEETCDEALDDRAGIEVHIEDLSAWCGIDFADTDSNPLSIGKARLVVNGETMENLVVPDGVTEIKAYAFEMYGALRSVSIPASVGKIGKNAFAYCARLRDVYVDDIGAWCETEFENFRANPLYPMGRLICGDVEVKMLDIPDGTKTVGAYSFYGYRRLCSVTLPQSLESIGDGAFEDCPKLVSVKNLSCLDIYAGATGHGSVGVYAKKVTREDDGGFFREHGAVFYEIADKLYLMDCDLDGNELVLPDLGKRGYEIYPTAFLGCEGFESVIIPPCVTAVGDRAFSGCIGLKKVELSEGLETLGNAAFSGCGALAEIELPESLTRIGERAFVSCKAIEEILLPGNLTHVSYATFRECEALEKVTISKGVKSVGAEAFANCGLLRDVELPDGLEWIDRKAFAACWRRLLIIRIPDTVKRIGARAFSFCHHLEDVELPIGLERIEDGLFEDCWKLMHVEIPNSVTYIGDSAFAHCGRLKNISIPEGVTYLGNNAFAGCSELREVIIPKSTAYLGKGLFSECGFREVSIPKNVDVISERMFCGCSDLCSVVIPGSLRHIEKDAFAGCTSKSPISVFYCGKPGGVNQTDADTSTKALPQFGRHLAGYEFPDDATIWYYSEKQPEESGCFWHFSSSGTPIIW